METLIVFNVPQGHLYSAFRVGSSTSLMTRITILAPDSRLDKASLSLVSSTTSDPFPSYITKSYRFLSMYHLCIFASSPLHRGRMTPSMASSC